VNQIYLNEIKNKSKKQILRMFQFNNYSYIKDDIYDYTKFMIFNESIGIRIDCYLNSINDYERCEFGNIKKFNRSLCCVYGCKCRSLAYSKSNKNRNYNNQSDLVKDQYKNIKNNIDNANLITKEDLIDLLKSEKYYYKKYFGKSKNRTLINDNIDIYKSILY